MEKIRLILAIILCMLVWVLWSIYSMKEQDKIDEYKKNIAIKKVINKNNNTEIEKNVIENNNNERVHFVEEINHTLKNELVDIIIEEKTATLSSWILKDYYTSIEKTEHIEMINEKGYTLNSPAEGKIFSKLNELPFKLLSKTDNLIEFIKENESASIKKTIIINENYNLDVNIKYKNKTSKIEEVKSVLVLADKVKEGAPKSSNSFFNPAPINVNNILYLINGSTEEAEKNEHDERRYIEFAEKGKIEWAGFDTRYFNKSIIPLDEELSVTKITSKDDVNIIKLQTSGKEIEPNSVVEVSYKVFLGPKVYELLKKVGYNLKETLDFWIVGAICIPMMWIMNHLNTFVFNWGITIIILTIIIKLLMYPLTQKSYKSMEDMKKLKPQMDEIKSKYGEDREKMNVEMMELYKRNKINPLGGCLPMLLQMPIYIAFYRMLYASVELYQATFIPGWIDDLSAKDPFFIMPIALGITMFVQQKMTPTAMDNAQAKMMLYFMPIFFTVIMLYLPSGLTLYIFVNTLLGIAHQFYIKKQNA